MISRSIKLPVTNFITPLCKFLLKLGISANAITILGTIASVASSAFLIPSGHLLAASLLITSFVLFDLLDGTMARLSERGANKFGALLDSSLDRVSDGALLLSLAWYLHKLGTSLEVVVYLNLLTGFLIPYIRAKAESLEIECSGGFAERTERLIISLVGIGFAGIGVPYILAGSIWVLFAVSIFTVAQRISIVYKAGR